MPNICRHCDVVGGKESVGLSMWPVIAGIGLTVARTVACVSCDIASAPPTATAIASQSAQARANRVGETTKLPLHISTAFHPKGWNPGGRLAPSGHLRCGEGRHRWPDPPRGGDQNAIVPLTNVALTVRPSVSVRLYTSGSSPP